MTKAIHVRILSFSENLIIQSSTAAGTARLSCLWSSFLTNKSAYPLRKKGTFGFRISFATPSVYPCYFHIVTHLSLDLPLRRLHQTMDRFSMAGNTMAVAAVAIGAISFFLSSQMDSDILAVGFTSANPCATLQNVPLLSSTDASRCRLMPSHHIWPLELSNGCIVTAKSIWRHMICP